VRRAGAQNTPLVLLDRRLPGVHVDTIRCDSVDGAWKLTRHLLGEGHRQIAMLSGPPAVSTAADRVKGYCRAMAEAGLSGNLIIKTGSFTCESGSEMTQQLLSLHPLPTAIFAANNFLAIGALRTLRAKNIKVPRQMSVVSFDDLPANLLVEPFLTVASQPAYEMGRTATQLLLDRIKNPSAVSPREVILPPQILIRRSTAPPEVLR
jgi:LacI family transcriptional regulator